jgi:hypothetical protein
MTGCLMGAAHSVEQPCAVAASFRECKNSFAPIVRAGNATLECCKAACRNRRAQRFICGSRPSYSLRFKRQVQCSQYQGTVEGGPAVPRTTSNEGVVHTSETSGGQPDSSIAESNWPLAGKGRSLTRKRKCPSSMGCWRTDCFTQGPLIPRQSSRYSASLT